MSTKRKYCPNDCNLRAYYLNQAGGGLDDIRIYRGYPYQAGGFGFGTILGKFGIPLLKFLGKHLLSTGVAVGSDILANQNFKSSVRNRLKESSKTAAKEGLNQLANMVDQIGTGRLYKARKRKRQAKSQPRKKSRKIIKRKVKKIKRKSIRDIFS